jgi:hypothetical protein
MKYIISLMIVFVLSNCEVKVRESNANRSRYDSYDAYNINVKGMNYLIMSTNRMSPDAGITVVNLTKDALEVEYYKKMLKQ